MGSIARGFRLAKASWTVVRQDRELIALPILSFLCSLVVMAVFALGAAGIGLPAQGRPASPGLYVLGFAFYVALSFVTVFFNAAVIGTAMKRLKGEPATLRDGLSLARAHLGAIFVWALITATVGMVIRTLQERSGILGRIVLGLIGFAWSVLTFFVIPVLLYEEGGVGDAIKRSGSIFRQRWGEQFVGNATIGLAIFLIAIPVVAVGGVVAAAAPIVGIPLLVIAVGAIMAVGAACSGVFNAALYRYATTGESSGAFTVEDMNSSFRPRRGGRGAGPFTPGVSTPGGFAQDAIAGDVRPAPPAEPPARPDA
jgi:Family of unknown function (DUF6159)